MVLGQGKISLLTKSIHKACFKRYSTKTAIKKSVFISQSKNVFENLALENWLNNNMNFKNHFVLMLWQNEPCIVMGRHKNPWLDTDHGEQNDNLKIARRYTGGRTFYQNDEYLNFTIFAPYEYLKKWQILEVIKRALFRKFNVESNVDKNKLLIKNKEISEVSSKISFPNAYQHCSLNVVKNLGNDQVKEYQTNKITVINDVMSAVGWEFLRTNVVTLDDGGEEEANRQKGFHMINPAESWFPGINHIKGKMESWQWIYGETPSFKITRTLSMLSQFTKKGTITENMKLKVIVNRGLINDISLHIPPGFSKTNFSGEAPVISDLEKQKFSKFALQSLMASLGENSSDEINDQKTVIERMQKVMTSI